MCTELGGFKISRPKCLQNIAQFPRIVETYFKAKCSAILLNNYNYKTAEKTVQTDLKNCR